MVCFGCLCFIIFVLFFSLKLSESFCFFLIRQFKRNKITVSVGKLRVSKKSVLQELAPSNCLIFAQEDSDNQAISDDRASYVQIIDAADVGAKHAEQLKSSKLCFSSKFNL